MFSIEHTFDATVVTLVDEGASHLQEDVVVSAFDDCITLTQVETHTDIERTVTLSLQQLRDLIAALNLPEGVYRQGETRP